MGFTIPNEADAFNADQAEPDSGDFEILARGYGRTGVLSGCAVSAQGSPDMTVAVASGTALVDGKRATVSSGNLTISAADATNPRLDLVTVDSSGTKAVVDGTAAAQPAYPAIPASRAVLAAVYVPASDTAIASNQITDKRVMLQDDLPWLIDVNVFATAHTNTNWDSFSANDTAAVYGFWKQSSGAQNDEIGWDVTVAAGTWTVELLHHTSSNRGIYSVQFDAVEKGTVDGYSASLVRNVRSAVSAISVSSSGKVRLTLKMATKNASSSSYFGAVGHVQLRRTA